MWLQSLLQGLGFLVETLMNMHRDSKFIIFISNNPTSMNTPNILRWFAILLEPRSCRVLSLLYTHLLWNSITYLHQKSFKIDTIDLAWGCLWSDVSLFISYILVIGLFSCPPYWAYSSGPSWSSMYRALLPPRGLGPHSLISLSILSHGYKCK